MGESRLSSCKVLVEVHPVSIPSTKLAEFLIDSSQVATNWQLQVPRDLVAGEEYVSAACVGPKLAALL